MESNRESQSIETDSHAAWLKRTFDRYQRPLVAYAAQLLGGNIEPARDCVQETFLSLCKEPRDQIQDYVEAWLFKTCRNRVVDHFRKEASMIARAEQSALRKQELGANDDPVRSYETREQQGRLEQQIRRLTDREQEVLSLRLTHGLTYRQIAEVTGLTATNVGVVLHQAVMKLRTALAEQT